ncbi:uncharacterized protein LOC120326964 [Styela clava]|uniref:uncharacterized protein LOC120326964 n=1 Tax=Styela clava TaxID=7725 RepID=UPI00193AC6BD|nr:uncharacterized protein LOC120326964 [Styela clava]
MNVMLTRLLARPVSRMVRVKKLAARSFVTTPRKLAILRQDGEEFETDYLHPEIGPPFGNEHWSYRCLPAQDPIMMFALDVIATFVWTVLWYSFYYHYDMLYPHHKVPVAEEWTDEELGIAELD